MIESPRAQWLWHQVDVQLDCESWDIVMHNLNDGIYNTT